MMFLIKQMKWAEVAKTLGAEYVRLGWFTIEIAFDN